MKRLPALFGMAAVVGGMLFGVAPAANADFHGTNCPGAPYACVWKEANFNTEGNQNAFFKWQMYFGDARDFKYAGTGYVVHNTASSFVNDATGRTVWMYNGLNCTGSEAVSKGPQTYDSTFNNDSPLPGGAFNDSLTSAAFSDYLSSC